MYYLEQVTVALLCVEGTLAGLAFRSGCADDFCIQVSNGGGRARTAAILLAMVLNTGCPSTLVQAPSAACQMSVMRVRC